jgi:3-demethoxyubiquinol 3-hydroxylase
VKNDKVNLSSSGAPKRTGDNRLPGDLTGEQIVERMLRVDHAGEYGAVRIYAGQLAVLGRDGAGQNDTRKSDIASVIREMAEAENKHLETFDKLLVERQTRPTLLAPFWHVAGFALGAGSALMGPRAAMACTAAVEEVIEEHYASQVEQLGDDEAELRQTLEEFRADEAEHKEIGLAHEAERAPGYEPLSAAIKRGTRLAIWLSERI